MSIVIATLLLATDGRAQLTRAIDIRTLPLERAAAGEEVALAGTVSFIDAPGTVFVQDETGGTFFRTKERLGPIRVGDIVEIKGKTVTGLYLTGIEATEFKITGHSEPPQPQPATFDDLATGRFHYQRVVIEGIGRRLTALDENRSLLHIAIGDRVVEARIDAPPVDLDVIDARVRITALAAGGINDRRQLVFPYLRVSDWSDVRISERAPNIDTLPITPAARLLRFGQPDEARHRVRVRGIVLASFADGRLFLRDDTPLEEYPVDTDKVKNVPRPSARALAVRLVASDVLPASQLVEVAGFPSMDGFSASLADAILLKQEPASSDVDATPAAVTAQTLLSGSYDADLVTMPAVLTDVFRTANGAELRLKADNTPLTAFLPSSTVPALATGTQVQLTGICQVEASSDKGFRSRPERAHLLLRGLDDIRVLHAPTWWTARRLLSAIGVLCGIILLGVLWIVALRRQVTKQADTLRQRVSREAALEERQRIAREFHDTLEQELAGLSIRLDAATTRPLEDKARTLLDTSRHLVSRIQTEARNLVADLRAAPDATADLGDSLRELTERVPSDADVRVELEVAEDLPPLPAHVVHHLRMMAQEAVTNALKHAGAKLIRISVAADTTALQLSIADDGRGFDAEAATHGQPGHFGCVGIRERCRKIGAEASWQSAPGHGTTLTVSLPLAVKSSINS